MLLPFNGIAIANYVFRLRLQLLHRSTQRDKISGQFSDRKGEGNVGFPSYPGLQKSTAWLWHFFAILDTRGSRHSPHLSYWKNSNSFSPSSLSLVAPQYSSVRNMWRLCVKDR